MAKGNFFKVYRSLLSDDMWLDEPFTKGQAWVDLIGLANYETSQTVYKGQLQTIKRGQIKASYGYFQKRWKRSRNWVIHFLRVLEGLEMITLEGTRYGITITIEKYTLYQGEGIAKGIEKGIKKGTQKRFFEGLQKKNNKELKNKRENIIKSEIIDGFLIETDADGREYAQKVEQ